MTGEPVTGLGQAFIQAASHAAMKRGALAVWTIYDRPKDHPNGFIARRFEIGHKVGPLATSDVLTGKLEALREAFEGAGLVKMARSERDPPHLVESWL
jgi:hypothetical protein